MEIMCMPIGHSKNILSVPVVWSEQGNSDFFCLLKECIELLYTLMVSDTNPQRSLYESGQCRIVVFLMETCTFLGFQADFHSAISKRT